MQTSFGRRGFITPDVLANNLQLLKKRPIDHLIPMPCTGSKVTFTA